MKQIDNEPTKNGESKKPTVGELMEILEVLAQQINLEYLLPQQVVNAINKIAHSMGTVYNALEGYERSEDDWNEAIANISTRDDIPALFTGLYHNELADKSAVNSSTAGLALGQDVSQIVGTLQQLKIDLANPKIRAQFRKVNRATGKANQQAEPWVVEKLESLVDQLGQQYTSQVIPRIADIEPFGSSYSSFDIKYLSTLDPNHLTPENIERIETTLRELSEDDPRFMYSILFLLQSSLGVERGISLKAKSIIYNDRYKATTLEASKVLVSYFKIYMQAAMDEVFISNGEIKDERKPLVDLSLLDNKMFGTIFAMYTGLTLGCTAASFERLLRSGYISSLTSEDITRISIWFEDINKRTEPVEQKGKLYESAEDLHKSGKAAEVFARLKTTLQQEETNDEDIVFLLGLDNKRGGKPFEKTVKTLQNEIVLIPIDSGEFSEILITASTPDYIDIFLVSTTNEVVLLQINAKGQILGIPEDYDLDTIPFVKKLLHKVIGALEENNILIRPQNNFPRRDNPAPLPSKPVQGPLKVAPVERTDKPPVHTIHMPRKRSQQRRLLGLPADLGAAGLLFSEMEIGSDKNSAYRIVMDDEARARIPENKLVREKLGRALRLLQRELRENGKSPRLHRLGENKGYSVHIKGYRAITRIETDPETKQLILKVFYFGPRDNNDVYAGLKEALRR